MTDGYLSKDRERINQLQRERRQSFRRIDYYASTDAQAAIEARRGREHRGGIHATNSAILDAIVREWAQFTGINKSEVETPMTAAERAGIFGRLGSGAYDFGAGPKPGEGLAKSRRRVPCGARKHRNGQPCRALSEPGRARCKWHGGRSTGPRTEDGKARALANLRQYRPRAEGGTS